MSDATTPVLEPKTPHQATIDAPTRVHYFTKENARINAAKGHAAKREARERKQLAILTAQKLHETESNPDAYVLVQLARVRALLDSIDAQLAMATDPLDRERLARAGATLSERERVLSGRPTPGQLRPRATPRPVKPDAEQVG